MIDPKNPNEVDLNTATEGKLLHVEGLGLERVRILIANRPFDEFNDLRKLEGFSENIIKLLQKNGATLSRGHLANQ
jgi:DNA uptake protein ComE-like DNA-binding protein